MTRWSLYELFVITGFAGVAAYCASYEQTLLGLLLFLTVICVRVAAVDFSIAGSLASGMVLLFGIPTIFLALWWSIHG